MAGIATRHFRLNNTDQFYESFSEAIETKMYLFIGRNVTWPNGDVTPPSANDQVEITEYQHWQDMIGLKKINSSDVSYAIARHNWANGTVYPMYSSNDPNLYSNTVGFYVMTEDYNIYKCLYNNGGAASTSQPTGTSASIITTNDSYQWKFMYTISAAEALKFVTTNYIPASVLSANNGSAQGTVQQAATNGSIEVVSVTAGGSAYRGHFGTAQAGNSSTITLATGASAVDDYYTTGLVYISSGTGSGQYREITNYVGATRVATVNTAFSVSPSATSNYTVGPKVNIDGNGTGFNAVAVANGAVSSVTVITSGSGYTRGNLTLTGNGGSGAVLKSELSPNAVAELGGYNVIMNTKLLATDTVFPLVNEYRKIGVIRDPIVDATGAVANASSYDATVTLSINTVVGTFSEDEFVSGGTSGANAIVAVANSTTLKLIGVQGTFAAAETVTGNTSSATANVVSVTDTTLRRNSGEILYIDLREPISRASDQSEDVKLVIKF